MKLKLITVFSISFCVVLILLSGVNNLAHTHVAGSPAAREGSIADPLTCSNCHAGGPNTIQQGWITSNIPPTGYVSGMTYNISATATTVGRVRFGFEISPQSPTGTYLGTMIDTSAQTQILYTKYITHTSSGTTGTDSKTWAFNWTAPITAVDSVTFYGAFLCANNNNSDNGDITYRSRLTVHRDITAGIPETLSSASDVIVYPNPVTDLVHVQFNAKHNGIVETKLYDDEGRLIGPLTAAHQIQSESGVTYKLPLSLNSGAYLLEFSSESTRIVKRILVQQ